MHGYCACCAWINLDLVRQSANPYVQDSLGQMVQQPSMKLR